MNSRSWQERKNKTVFEKCAADWLVNMHDNLSFFISRTEKARHNCQQTDKCRA